MYSVVAAITQESFESRQVVRSRYDEYLFDACQHKYTDGVIDHRFVEDGQQLFADTFCYRIETSAGPARKNYAFHLVRS